jgi:hypothetical protein
VGVKGKRVGSTSLIKVSIGGQWASTARNTERAWARHLKRHPNDVKAKEDIKEARKGLKY